MHASAVVLGEAGVLITGPSGAGKSTLSHALVEEWQARGRFARWVADDRVVVAPQGGRLVARPPARIAGLAERTGVGVVPVEHLAAARLTLLVELSKERLRTPEPCEAVASVCGIALPRLVVERRATATSLLAVAAVLAGQGLTGLGCATQRPAAGAILGTAACTGGDDR
ncbi:HPr kinase/phosphorylase [Acuticoccus sp.]|uniref:HPr kinase/phosphorylase n=1 Tax=Acuticoccus sp. TaxID=1904378 RepID=UPI003B51877D